MINSYFGGTATFGAPQQQAITRALQPQQPIAPRQTLPYGSGGTDFGMQPPAQPAPQAQISGLPPKAPVRVAPQAPNPVNMPKQPGDTFYHTGANPRVPGAPYYGDPLPGGGTVGGGWAGWDQGPIWGPPGHSGQLPPQAQGDPRGILKKGESGKEADDWIPNKQGPTPQRPKFPWHDGGYIPTPEERQKQQKEFDDMMEKMNPKQILRPGESGKEPGDFMPNPNYQQWPQYPQMPGFPDVQYLLGPRQGGPWEPSSQYQLAGKGLGAASQGLNGQQFNQRALLQALGGGR